MKTVPINTTDLPGGQHHRLPQTLPLYLIPAVTFFLVGAVGIIRATPPPVAARVYGGPSTPEGLALWRVAVVHLSHGLSLPVRGMHVSLTATAGNSRAVVHGVTDDLGGWDVSVPLKISGKQPAHVVVSARSPETVLVDGVVHPKSSAWRRGFRRFAPKLSGSHRGNVRVRAWAVRGALVSSFPDQVLVQILRASDRKPAAYAQLHFEGGAINVHPSHMRADDQGRALISVTPRFVSPMLEVRVQGPDDLNGHWEGLLPAVAGSVWLDPAERKDGSWIIRAPTGHAVVYADLISNTTRLGTWKVAMTRQPDGTSLGILPKMHIPPDRPLWMLLSTTPPEVGGPAARLGWPLQRAGVRAADVVAKEAIQFRVPVMLDGLPAAVRRSRHLAHTNRIILLSMLALGSMLETVALWLYTRRAQQGAERWAKQQGDIEDEIARLIIDRGGQRWMTLAAAIIIAVAFSALAWVSWLWMEP